MLMKELDRFTSERLESLCDYRPNRVTNLINFREIAALARIALAAKRAEPVMFRFKYPGERNYTYITHRKPDAFEMEKCEIELLYTTPQLNSPEIRKLILSEVSDFCAGLGQPGEPELPEDIQQALMNRIELVFNNCG
ncbi:hypothetical protein [Yersinia mollaretii]|uniref:hypothetical protein n=1 Tax=Yersinia mollaretii TaxID=33060 RepID=UPI00061C3838|nr:hypothetical protein [Yersinia mollaretii]CNJ53322.1 Uncharacterised protein [Yersinia mollaretii]